MTKERNRKSWFKAPGKPLPKRLLRPFTYENPISVDDKQFVIPGLGDRVGVIIFLMAFPYAIAFGGGIIWAAFHFNQPIALSVSIASLIIAVTMHYKSKHMEHTQFTVFDRENGTVAFPKGLFSSGMLYGPWEDWSARLWIQSTSVGAAQHTLSIVHLPTQKMGMLTASITGFNMPLGFWSFLVQYMDKNAPLPNIAELESYPNRTDGLGTWEEWEKGASRVGKRDPYYEWLAELKEDPSLDEVNAGIQAHRCF